MRYCAAAAWIMLCLFAVYNGYAAGFCLLAVSVLCFAISALYLRISERSSSLDIKIFSDKLLHKDKSSEIRIHFSSKSGKKTCGNYACTLCVKNLLTGESKILKKKLRFTDNSEVVISVKSKYCGKLCFSFEKCRAVDFLGLTYKSCDVKVSGNAVCIPNFSVGKESFEKLQACCFDSTEYLSCSGKDISEPFGIRPFRNGDSVKSIHHKMSYRFGEIYVTEGTKQASGEIAVMADILKGTGAESCDRLVTAAVGASRKLLSMGKTHFIICESKSGVKSFEIRDEKSLFCAVGNMLSISTWKENYNDNSRLLFDELERLGVTVLAVSSDCEMPQNRSVKIIKILE